MKRVIEFILAALICWAAPVDADQNDPQLEDLFERLQQTDEAEAGETITQRIWEVWYEVPDSEAQELFNRGVAFMARGDYRSALITFTQVTEVSPKFAEGWNRRATLLYLMGKFSLSMQDIRQTLVLEPRHFGAISGMGQILMRQNKLKDARQAFQKALEINPHLHGARLNILQINKMLSESSV